MRAADNPYLVYLKSGFLLLGILVPLSILPWTLTIQPDAVKWFLLHMLAIYLIVLGIIGTSWFSRPVCGFEKRVILACLALLPSVFCSRNPGLSLKVSTEFCLLILLASLICHLGIANLVLTGLLIAAGLASILGALQQYLHWDPIHWQSHFLSKALSTFGNPNYLGSFCAGLAPVALHMACFGRKAVRGLAAVLLLVFAAALVASMSLGACLSALGGLAAWTLLTLFGGKKARMVLFVPMAVWLATLLLSWNPPTQNQAVDPGGRVAIRRLMWHVSQDIARDHLLLGCGAGLYPKTFAGYQKATFMSHPRLAAILRNQLVTHAHNDFLELLATWGLPGLCGVGWLFYATLWQAMGMEKSMQSACACGLFSLLLAGMVSFPLFLPAGRLLMFCLLGGAAQGPIARVDAVRLHPRSILIAAFALTFGAWFTLPSFVAEYHVKRGTRAMHQRDHRRARAHFEKAVHIQPYDPWIHYFVGSYYAAKQQYLLSIQHFEKARALYENYFFDYRQALAHMETQDFEKARGLFEETLRLNPVFEDAMGNLALACYHLRDYGAAERWYRALLRRQPDDPDLYYNLALIRKKCGDAPGAMKLYHMALQKDPLYARASFGLVQLYLLEGERDLAETVLKDLRDDDRFPVPVRRRAGQELQTLLTLTGSGAPTADFRHP